MVIKGVWRHRRYTPCNGGFQVTPSERGGKPVARPEISPRPD
nr:hypothetical protein [Caulobacter sp. RHG1]